MSGLTAPLPGANIVVKGTANGTTSDFDGKYLLENLDPNVELVNYFNYIEHIHISEPKLVVIKEVEFHINFSKTIKNLEYNKTIT